MTMSSKPSLVSHFLHTGPALSDFNSSVSVITHPVSTAPASTNQTSTSSGSAIRSTAAGSLPPPVVCSPFTKLESAAIEKAWQTLSARQQARARSIHKVSSAPNSTQDPRPHSDQLSKQRLDRYDHPSNSSSQGAKDSEPTSGRDPKGKGKLSETDIDLDEIYLSTHNSGEELVADEDADDDGDGVLNLSMEAQSYIVPVGLDSLFTVDVRRLKLYPAFWHGPRLEVYRGEWFYPSTSKSKFYPCEPELSEALEAAYDQIRPWEVSYEDELRSALQIGTEAEDKLKVHLKIFDHDVIFQSATHGRLYSTAVSSRISKTILTNFFTRISNQPAGYSGGTVVVRGWDQARRWSGALREDNPEAKSQDADELPSFGRPATGQNTTAEIIEEDELANSKVEVAELVLVIHGIGQKLAQSYDSFDFVHACNQLRVECNKLVKTDPKMKSFIQDKRVQFIPIRWRHSLNFEMEGFDDEVELKDGQEKEPTRNTFAMKDIQVADSIPFVREIVSSLVLDVPLYMSPKQHKVMIAAVVEQANKVYGLFCRRNSYYAGRKVSILAHSLGAALTVDILSNQPNVAPSAHAENPAPGVENFCFDTRNVFLVGSPVAFFFHLHRAQLIAREGVSKMTGVADGHSAEWRKVNRIATEVVGQYGCLAAETVYNIYISTDPVAYLMNACADSRYAKRFKPIDAQSFSKRFLDMLAGKDPNTRHLALKRTVSLASLSSLVVRRSWFGPKAEGRCEVASERLGTKDMAGSEEDQEMRRAASDTPPMGRWADVVRKHAWTGAHAEVATAEPVKMLKEDDPIGGLRFQALNPTGSIDFVIPSLGLNQYVDMVTAHAAYWNDSRFAKLMLIKMFGESEVLKEVGEIEVELNRRVVAGKK